jgi:translocation and assembly module TamB
VTVALSAESEKDHVPFQFLLSNATNKVDVQGDYFLKSEEIDASVDIDVTNLELFSFLTSGVLDEMKGGLKGEARITGKVEKPEVKGYLQFVNAGLTTLNPKFTFNIPDGKIAIDGSRYTFEHFVMYDRSQHPLTLSGYMDTEDFESIAYDLKINTDDYTLLDIPVNSKEQVKGLLVVGTDIVLTGNEKDTYVKADITIQDTTYLTYSLASSEDDLLKTEGIVAFVDPALTLDSTALDEPASFYDSLITSLPEFNLNSKIIIEDKARLRVITNAQSGDYFEVSGGSHLELSNDRTGNANMVGNYTIKEGVYRVSFYDLVRKDFRFVPGSAITWSGSPQSGQLDLRAVYTVASNSIGLVGHEIGENEKSIYKRSLDYEVGVNIRGTIDKPVVTFSLDLPKEERSNYPVLANKLDRLRLPEFQSELNKQVFGLLVLGGFLPDASLTDVNSNQIATTALYNSVNSLLASQLNRVAGQYIKGVNIDVGIQSYSDYSTPGGKTQTAMDFRVSKSVLNDRLSFEVGGDFDINSDQSGANTGDNYRGDVAIIYDLTGNGDKQLKLFNNETYDIVYQEIRNTGISLVFIREFDKGDKIKRRKK